MKVRVGLWESLLPEGAMEHPETPKVIKRALEGQPYIELDCEYFDYLIEENVPEAEEDVVKQSIKNFLETSMTKFGQLLLVAIRFDIHAGKRGDTTLYGLTAIAKGLSEIEKQMNAVLQKG